MPETVSRAIRKWKHSGGRITLEKREQAYSEPGRETNDSYAFRYRSFPLVKQRLAQAEIRLAGLLNEVFASQ